jgi:FkbM family methyltransferase
MQKEPVDMIAAEEVPRTLPDILARQVEKLKLQYRAEKYQYQEDRGGIAYIRKTVQKGDTVFDIGAHKAGYLYFFLEQCGMNGKIVAFEPQSVLYKYLLRLKKIFNWKNINIEPFAVSRQSGNALLCIPYNNGRQSSPCATIIESHMDFKFQLKEEVSTITLDEYCHLHDLYPDFLKVDVEGNELSVFKGARELLRSHKPKILFESEARFVGYKGYFIMGESALPIEEFDINYHQNPDSGIYCNNFIFE